MNLTSLIILYDTFSKHFYHQDSTKYSPYFLMFNREPHMPAYVNATPLGEFDITDPTEDIDERIECAKALNAKVSVIQATLTFFSHLVLRLVRLNKKKFWGCF